MPTVAFITLGCKVNQYDTAGLEALFRARGYRVVRPGGPADACVVNTCAVTGRSQAKSRHAVRHAARLCPGAVLAVAGCGPELFPEEFALPGVAVMVGCRGRRRLVDLVDAALAGRPAPRATPQAPEPWPPGFEELPGGLVEGRTRGVLKVQEGCDQHCAYCLVPRARGPGRSRPPQAALEEARSLAARGCREIVVCGIHLGAYGREWPRDRDSEPLVDLLDRLCRVPGLERIRLSSIEPMDATPALLEAVAGWPKLCRHLHLPLQSGSDHVLRGMGRPYTAACLRGLVRRLRALNPEVAVTTDVMVGFPGESEEDFALTLGLAEELELSRLHVFRYSARPGTPAAALPGQVGARVKEERSRRLIELGSRLALHFHRRYLGRLVEVLVETSGAGLTSNYIRVRLRGRGGPVGRLCPVRVAAADADGVEGVLEREGSGGLEPAAGEGAAAARPEAGRPRQQG